MPIRNVCAFTRWSRHGHALLITPLHASSLHSSSAQICFNSGHIRPFSNMMYFLLHHKWSSPIIPCHLCSSLYGYNASTHTIPFHFWSHIYISTPLWLQPAPEKSIPNHPRNQCFIWHFVFGSLPFWRQSVCSNTLCGHRIHVFRLRVYSSAKVCGNDFISRPRSASTLAWALVFIVLDTWQDTQQPWEAQCAVLFYRDKDHRLRAAHCTIIW